MLLLTVEEVLWRPIRTKPEMPKMRTQRMAVRPVTATLTSTLLVEVMALRRVKLTVALLAPTEKLWPWVVGSVTVLGLAQVLGLTEAIWEPLVSGPPVVKVTTQV